eukprot:19016-Heterococcus_DN1.PRE.4
MLPPCQALAAAASTVCKVYQVKSLSVHCLGAARMMFDQLITDLHNQEAQARCCVVTVAAYRKGRYAVMPSQKAIVAGVLIEQSISLLFL